MGVPQWEDPGQIVVGSPYRREQGQQLDLKPEIDAWFRSPGVSHVRGRGSAEGGDEELAEAGTAGSGGVARVGRGARVASGACEAVPTAAGGADSVSLRVVRRPVFGKYEATSAESFTCEILFRELQAERISGAEEEPDACSGRYDSGNQAVRGLRPGLQDEQAKRIEALFPSLHDEKIVLEEEVGPVEVYDLSVDVARCFFLEAGVIASNCDALRYMVMSLHLARLRGMRVRFEDITYDGDDKWDPLDPIVGY
jgi:hypothetical protein